MNVDEQFYQSLCLIRELIVNGMTTHDVLKYIEVLMKTLVSFNSNWVVEVKK